MLRRLGAVSVTSLSSERRPDKCVIVSGEEETHRIQIEGFYRADTKPHAGAPTRLHYGSYQSDAPICSCCSVIMRRSTERPLTKAEDDTHAANLHYRAGV